MASVLFFDLEMEPEYVDVIDPSIFMHPAHPSKCHVNSTRDLWEACAVAFQQRLQSKPTPFCSVALSSWDFIVPQIAKLTPNANPT